MARLRPQPREQAKPAIAAGARGKIRFADSTFDVLVVEDRGRVGSQGRHIVRVRYLKNNSPDEVGETFEVRASDLQLAG